MFPAACFRGRLQPGRHRPAGDVRPAGDTCHDPAYPQENLAQAGQILYANEDQLWLWDEASQEKILVNLPAEAVSPHISPALLFSEIPAASSSCRSNQMVAFAYRTLSPEGSQ